MNHYIDIKIMPDAEMRENELLNKLYVKLHKALHALGSTDIGVSFPNYKVKLGDVIRIHGAHSRLEKLQNTNWLGGLNGYCENSGILQIPKQVSYRTISRVQTNMSLAKLRRLRKRKSLSDEEVKQYRAKMFSQGLDNPFVEIESSSNGHKHRRYICFGKLDDNQTEGSFDTFGLSKTATIPWFT